MSQLIEGFRDTPAAPRERSSIRTRIMADPETRDSEAAAAPAVPTPSLEDMQHWTWVMGRAQQLMMEHLAAQMGEAAKATPDPEIAAGKVASAWPGMHLF